MARKRTTAAALPPEPPMTADKTLAKSVIEDARRAGLLDGEKLEHLSFRVPPALLAEARRRTGISSPTELGIAALALLAAPDPVADFMKTNRGALADLPQIEP